MSIVERMLPWDRQPPGPADLADQRQVFGYSRNRIFLARPAGTTVTEPTAQAAAPTDSAGPHGTAGSYNGTSSGWLCSPAFTGIPGEATLIAMVRPAVADSSERTVISCSSAADENPLFRLQTNASNQWRFQIRGTTTAANIAGTTAVVAGTMAIVGGVYRDSTREKSLWVNGAKEATDSTSLGSGPFTRTTLGVLARSTNFQFFSGLIYEAHILPFAASDAWMADATKSPEHLFAAIYAPRRIWVPVSAVGTHTTTGALAAGSATVSGAALHPHTTTGALSAQSATVAGSAVHPHLSTGALAAQAATVSGTAVHPHTTTGALAAQAATVAGDAEHTAPATHATTGALAASAATVSGTAVHLTLHTSTGALVADAATVSGVAQNGDAEEATSRVVRRRRTRFPKPEDPAEQVQEQPQAPILTPPRTSLVPDANSLVVAKVGEAQRLAKVAMTKRRKAIEATDEEAIDKMLMEWF